MALTNEMKNWLETELCAAKAEVPAEQQAYAAISAVQREADQRVAQADAGMKAAWAQCDMLNKQLAKKDDVALRLYHKMQSDLASLTALRDELDIQIADQARTLRDFVEML